MVSEFPWERRYRVSDMENVLTPALVVYPEVVASNIARTLHLLGGNADRWRAHIKTAKLAYTLAMLASVAFGFQMCNHARTPASFLAHLQFQFLWHMLAFRFETATR
jgi:hypothetical protein